jgi:hypothetical protein
LATLLLVLFATAAAAPSRLTEAEVRAFVARQETAWTAGDLNGFFGLFTREATFTDQARAKDGRVVPYGTSTLAQARAQASRLFATSKVRETNTVTAIQIAADGRSARVSSRQETFITRDGKTRHLCGESVETVVRTPAGLRSTGQLDTSFASR